MRTCYFYGIEESGPLHLHQVALSQVWLPLVVSFPAFIERVITIQQSVEVFGEDSAVLLVVDT